MDDKDITYFLGIFALLILWVFCNELSEWTKVECGYLEYRDRIYKVELYDDLQFPVKKEELNNVDNR